MELQGEVDFLTLRCSCYLGEISLMLMSRQDFANAGQMDGRHSPNYSTTDSPFGRIKVLPDYLSKSTGR